MFIVLAFEALNKSTKLLGISMIMPESVPDLKILVVWVVGRKEIDF
jgi:hypothetical protein